MVASVIHLLNRTEFLLVAVLIIAVLIGLIVVTYKRRKSANREHGQEKKTEPEEAPKEGANTWRERYRMK